jgi:ethanolamine ammonia-lyase small subunit
MQGFPVISTLAENRLDFVLYPPKGKRALPETIINLEQACPKGKDVQIVISDGLSANAVDANIYDLLPMLQLGLQQEGISSGLPVVVQLGRVAIADQIAHALDAKVAVNLIGERPGLSCASGMSAYITYNPGPQTISSDRTVVSNIHAQGTPPVEAGAYIVSLIKKILALKVSGVKLQQLG